jgi:hypothetical protein
MHRLIAAGILAVGFLLGMCQSRSQAQYPYSPYSPYSPYAYGGYSRPTLSPYLNLVRGGNRAANYFLGVVPEIDRRNQYPQFSSQIQDLERRANNLASTEESPPQLQETGHAAQFGNLSPYFTYGSSYLNSGSIPGAGQSSLRSPPGSRRTR